MSEMVEKLRSIIERQKDERGDMLYKNGIPDAWLAEAANRIEALESALAVMVGLARAHASNTGSMHAWWDTIMDAESILKDTR